MTYTTMRKRVRLLRAIDTRCLIAAAAVRIWITLQLSGFIAAIWRHGPGGDHRK